MSSILITGGAGFIGVNSARHFAAKGWAVTVVDNLSRRGTEDNLQWLQAAHASNRQFDVESLVRRMIEGEVPAMQAELEAHGRWPAPAGWLPDNERARSLIQTGRPPPDPRR